MEKHWAVQVSSGKARELGRKDGSGVSEPVDRKVRGPRLVVQHTAALHETGNRWTVLSKVMTIFKNHFGCCVESSL